MSPLRSSKAGRHDERDKPKAGRKPTGSVVVGHRKDGATVYTIRFQAGGRRRTVTLGSAAEGWDRTKAETELRHVLADVERGLWQPPTRAPAIEQSETPTFHEFASEWFERHKHEVQPRTIEYWLWVLSGHLPFFKDYPLDAITVEVVDRFKVAKQTERERMDAEEDTTSPVGLNATSINKCLALVARILEEALDYGHIDRNPAKGRRLRSSRPPRTFLEPHEAQAFLDNALPAHRPLLATMILAGLRVGELTALRWRNVDLAGGTLHVAESKTDAGVREVDVSPMLREILVLHKAAGVRVGDDDLVFATRNGGQHNRNNVRCKMVHKAVERANAKLAEAGMPPIADGITNHSLRRTFASLLYEAGASPAYVMSQMGHTSAGLALEVYAKKMARSRDTGQRMDALLQSSIWAEKGATESEELQAFTIEETKITD
jgi:integrase